MTPSWKSEKLDNFLFTKVHNNLADYPPNSLTAVELISQQSDIFIKKSWISSRNQC